MAEHLFPIQKPKILLINFTKKEEKELKDKQYNVERGWVASSAHHLPSPGYEYDIVIARFEREGFDDARKVSQYGTQSWEDLNKLQEKMNKNGFVLVFTDDGTQNIEHLHHAGIQSVSLEDLDERDTQYTLNSEFKPAVERQGFDFIRSVIRKYYQDIKIPIPKSIPVIMKNNRLDLPEEEDIAIGWNAAGKAIGMVRFEPQTKWNEITRSHEPYIYKPKHIILPPFKDNYLRIVNEILSQLPAWRPDLFSETDNTKWFEDPKYYSPELPKIIKSVEEENERHEIAMSDFQSQINSVVSADKFMRQLLIADDSDEFEEDDNFSTAVMHALKYIGFNVQKKDKEIREGKRREDLEMEDGDFNALVECKGTISVNPPESYFSKLTQHIMSHKQRKSDKGLLVVNHDRKRDAFSRGKLYEQEKHLWEEPGDITILSSVELFKIVRAVQNEQISKDYARQLIKTPGRVEFVLPTEDKITNEKNPPDA